MSEVASTLSASEQAHIESGGETPIETTTPEVENTEAVQTPEGEQTQEQEKVQKTVPLAALHEERAKAKELKERLRLGEERLNQLAQIVQQRLNPPPKPPEITPLEVDPVAHFREKNAALERQVQELAQPLQRMQQQTQAQQQYAQLQHFVGSQVAEFAQQTPDIGDAIGHVQQADIQALVALGHDPRQAAQIVQQNHDQLVMHLAQQGVNIPERIYALAKAKGYAPKAPAADAQTKIQATQRGVAAAKSLGSGGGVVNGLSLQALAAMSPEEFAEATSGKNEAAWRKLMGG